MIYSNGLLRIYYVAQPIILNEKEIYYCMWADQFLSKLETKS
jgi:hypothetical protein